MHSYQGGLQGGFLKRLRDVVSVCCVSSSHSDRLDDDQIRSVEHWLFLGKNLTGLLQLMAK